jgi:hypothetical protein
MGVGTYDVEAEGAGCSEFELHAKLTIVLFDEDTDPEEVESEAAGEDEIIVCCV